MKWRLGVGSASKDDVVLKHPTEKSVRPEVPAHRLKLDEERAKALHERAIADVKKSRRHRNETLRAAVVQFLKGAIPKVLGLSLVFGGIMYDAIGRHGTLTGTIEEFLAVFGLIFSLLVWAWNRD